MVSSRAGSPTGFLLQPDLSAWMVAMATTGADKSALVSDGDAHGKTQRLLAVDAKGLEY